MIDLTQLVIAALTLLFGCISSLLIPYLKTKLDGEKLERIKFWVNIAVEAAETVYKDSGKGQEKKAYVQEFLNGKGFKLNMDEIDKLIEAAVQELKLAA